MALGKQFKDTFWEDPEGNKRTYVDTGNFSPFFGDLSRESESDIHGEKNLQGLLFDPFTATGRKEDPLAKDRRGTISRSFNTDDKELIDAIDDSGMPIRQIQGINTNAFVSNKPSFFHSAAGYYNPELNEIHVEPSIIRSRPGTARENENQFTIIHESGHYLDPSVHYHVKDKDRFPGRTSDYYFRSPKPDPHIEGRADALADRHTDLKNVYEDRVPEAVVAKMAGNLSTEHNAGDRHAYGLNNSAWKSEDDSETHINKALYAATRILGSRSDTAFADLPNRTETNTEFHGWGLGPSGVNSNAILLGRYVHENPNIVRALHSIDANMGKAALEAHETFKNVEPGEHTSLKNARDKAKEEKGEQLELPGMSREDLGY